MDFAAPKAEAQFWRHQMVGPQKLNLANGMLVWSPQKGGEPTNLQEKIIPTLALRQQLMPGSQARIRFALPEGNLVMIGLKRANTAVRLALRYRYRNNSSKIGIIGTKNGELSLIGKDIANSEDPSQLEDAFIEWNDKTITISYGDYSFDTPANQLAGKGAAQLVIQCLRPAKGAPEVRIANIELGVLEDD